jgi:hypothetical protein
MPSPSWVQLQSTFGKAFCLGAAFDTDIKTGEVKQLSSIALSLFF